MKLTNNEITERIVDLQEAINEDKETVTKRIERNQFSAATVVLESIVEMERKIEVYTMLLIDDSILTTLTLKMASQTEHKSHQSAYEAHRSKAEAQILTALIRAK